MDNNINNMISISMPKGCRYMSDYENLLNGELPLDGKFILNKTVTGCGGTSLFLDSNFPVVIISPRLQVLRSTDNIPTVFTSMSHSVVIEDKQ